MAFDSLESWSWLVGLVTAVAAAVSGVLTYRTSRKAHIAAERSQQAAQRVSVRVEALRQLGIDYGTLQSTGITFGELEHIEELLNRAESAQSTAGDEVDELTRASRRTEAMADLVRIAVARADALQDELNRRSRVSSWLFFGAGVVISIAVGVAVNILTG